MSEERKPKDNPNIKQHLLDTIYPMKCEKLVLEELNEYERGIAVKCVNHETLTDTEYDDLKKLLSKWDKATSKINPNEIVENIGKAHKQIKTAQEFINIMRKDKKIIISLPYAMEFYDFEFIVQPITDSRALQGLALELELFKNYTDYEKETYVKAQKGVIISPEEQAIANKISKELEKNIEANQDEVIIKFLARQLKLNDDATHEEMIEFWSLFPINARVAAFIQTEELLGISESKNFELFPVIE